MLKISVVLGIIKQKISKLLSIAGAEFNLKKIRESKCMQVNASKCMHGDVWVCMSMLTVLNRHANSQTSLA